MRGGHKIGRLVPTLGGAGAGGLLIRGKVRSDICDPVNYLIHIALRQYVRAVIFNPVHFEETNIQARNAAAEVLRSWALDEDLKRRVMESPELAGVAARVAKRYFAGETVEDALTTARASIARGHADSIE